MLQQIEKQLIRIKTEKPIVLNIVKYFSLDLIVSGLRSIGALPLTSSAMQEAEDLLKLSKAVVINLGELDEDFIQLCDRICIAANKLKIPIVLDPIGAGVSHYRTETCINFIKKHKISIVRGYPSEISALLNTRLITTDNVAKANELACENAKLLSEKYNMAVVVSGKINTVICGDKKDLFNFDSRLLLKVAGISSLLSSLIGVFHAVEEDRFIAATTAVEYYAICVGAAKNKASGPGSFRSALIDELYINFYECIN